MIEEQTPPDAANICGMKPTAAKEYIINFIATLKLTEKQVCELDQELSKWQQRIDLAKSNERPDLAAEAEKECERITLKRQQLSDEVDTLKKQIDEMRRQLPLLAARERSVDPYLLEQELIMALGYLPGEEEKAHNERQFAAMEKAAAADDALLQLKAKMSKE